MLCHKCGSDDHFERQADESKVSSTSIRSGILHLLDRCVPAIYILPGIANSLEDDETGRVDDEGETDDLVIFNMLLASPDSENNFDPAQEEVDVIHSMEREAAAVGRLSPSSASGQPNINAPSEDFQPVFRDRIVP